MYLGQKNSFLLLFKLLSLPPKSHLLIHKYLKPANTSPAALAASVSKKTSTEDPLHEWCLIMNMFIEDFIAAFTGSVVNHRRQLGNETLMSVLKYSSLNNSWTCTSA